MQKFIKNTALFGFFFAVSFAIPTSIHVLAKTYELLPKENFTQTLKFENKEYRIESDSSVSIEPIRHIRIKKIAYGKETYVNIIETSSGVYSSNALISDNIIYKGIKLQKTRNKQPKDAKIWLLEKSWIEVPIISANSIISVAKNSI